MAERLYEAIGKGETQKALLLLDESIVQSTINELCGEFPKSTCLHLACTHENLPVIRKILSLTKLELCDKHHWGTTALENAAKEGKLEVVKLLINSGARIKPNIEGHDPIDCASANGHSAVVQFLMQHESNIEEKFGRIYQATGQSDTNYLKMENKLMKTEIVELKDRVSQLEETIAKLMDK